MSYFEWVKNLGHVRFGRRQKRFEQGAYGRLLEAVESVTGRRFTAAELGRMTHGASEEDLVNSGLEEIVIGAYHPMSVRIAINGLGRIGRALVNLAIDDPSLEPVATTRSASFGRSRLIP